jgi:O-antigen biosynthesis protein
MARSPGGGPLGGVDTAVAVDEEAVFLDGWLSGVGEPDRIRIGGPGGGADVIDLGHRFARPDVVRETGGSSELNGFACLVSLPKGPLDRSGLRLEIQGARNGTTILGVPDPIVDPNQGRRRVLRLLELGRPRDEFMAQHAYPAIERLTRRTMAGLGVRDVVERGQVPSSPEVSIVIPVYGQLDLVTPQIALLARDPEIREVELVLVLDSPELEDALVDLSHHLHELYRLPMRIVILNQNAGFGTANNLGVEHAAGSNLLLLNSDVFPDRTGWLSALVEVSRSDDAIAAVGPKLLYEDDSIQHAGMYFERDAVIGHWQNLHYHKGMPGTLPAADEPRRVPALTAACVLMSRADFTEAGGFDPSYVLGDYEDSELCLRLQESGRECRYTPAAELYHLERQSFAERLEKPGGSGHVAYNRWLFTHRWDRRVEELMAAFPEATRTTPPTRPIPG